MIAEALQYVPLHEVEARKAEGWTYHAGLEGTHHGEYAALMEPPQTIEPPRTYIIRQGRAGLELVIGKGNHECEVHPLTDRQVRNLARDLVNAVLR